MPFTLAHPAAVVPLRRFSSHVPFLGLVVGSMAPDFEYLLRLRPYGSGAHSFPGVLLFTVPLAFLVTWLADRTVLPGLRAWLGMPHAPVAPNRPAAMALAVVIGVMTHLAWDSVTHQGGMMVQAVPLLSVTPFGEIPLFKWLQHGSSVAGLTVVGAILVSRVRRLDPAEQRRLVPFIVVSGMLCLVFGLANATRATEFRQGAGYFAVGVLCALSVVAIAMGALSLGSRRATSPVVAADAARAARSNAGSSDGCCSDHDSSRHP
jgi:hypothetical protein